MKARHLSLILLATIVSPFGWSAEKATPETDFQTLTSYYEEKTQGLIRPTQGANPETPAQDYFALDVEEFVRRSGKADFIEALTDFYKSRKFSKSKQRYEKPYYYMQSWRELFHPPVKRLTLPTEVYAKEFGPVDRSWQNLTYISPEFQHHLDEISNSELSFGNELRLLPNRNSYLEKLRLIRDAKKSFMVATMLWFCHSDAAVLVDELIKKRREGVEVKVMVEGLYATLAIYKCINKMKAAGIEVTKVSDVYKPKSFTSIMHHKFWIRDGEEAIIGGQNMHDYSNKSDGFNQLTRDTDLLIRGPAVTDLVLEHSLLWNKFKKEGTSSSENHYIWALKQMEWERSRGLRGAENYERHLGPTKENHMNGVCRILVQRANATHKPIAPVIEALAREARHHILLTSPSVKFDKKKHQWQDDFARLLKSRAAEGLTIDVLTNGVGGGSGDLSNMIRHLQSMMGPDHDNNEIYKLLTGLDVNRNVAGAKKQRENLKDLRRNGIRSWTYNQFIHAKQYLFDRMVVSVGSFNFDHHSSEKNHESTAVCMDHQLAEQMERQFVLDLINSIPVVSANEN